MTDFHIDYESRGTADIEEVGLYNYVYHPETQPLFLSYAFDNEPWQTWRIYLGESIPKKVHEGFLDPSVNLVAFNSAFERHTTCRIGYQIGSERFTDPQVGGRYLSMPGALEDQGNILELPPEMRKDKRGDALIKMFCMPQKSTKTEIKKGAPEFYWYDWDTHPKEWAEFVQYGGQDIVAERELLRRMRILRVLPLPPFEQRLWLFDQKVNDRGMPVDMDFVQKMYNLALRSKKEAKDAQNAITGLENSNSRDQLLPWLKVRGYPRNTLRKETVDSVMKDPEVKLTGEARQVLKMRREAASTTYTKLPAIMRAVSPDGRLKGQFIFMGSARCGRWAGNAVQLHNMARPAVVGEIKDDNGKITRPGHDFEDVEVVKEARRLIYAEDYEGIKAKYGSVLLVIKSVIRTVFVAPEER